MYIHTIYIYLRCNSDETALAKELTKIVVQQEPTEQYKTHKI